MGRFRDYPTGVVPTSVGTKHLAPRTGDDIVHPLWKHRDTCNELVVGSNPTRGADLKRRRKAFFSYTATREKSANALFVRIRKVLRGSPHACGLAKPGPRNF